jgi:tetratricopeptide (TPR) repeat protein
MRKFSPLAFALLFGASLAMANDLQEASRLLKAGQPQQALESVNKVLAAKPRDPQARFLRGLILTEQGNTREAIDVFTRLTQDYPDLPEPHNNLAVIYASQGEYDKARASLERSIRTHPSYATAYENLGDVYAKLASQAYGKALQLDASNAGAKNKLSLVRELVGTPAPATPVVVAQAKEPAKPVAKEPAKPVAKEPAKPVAVVKEAAKPAADPSPDILKAVNAWAEAWSKKDVDGYLAHYAKDFKTPGGEARASWEKSRRARITAPKSIAVAVASPKVTVQGADAASVSFRQTYASDVLKANSAKTLVMVKADGRWLIREEKSGN